MKLINYWTEIDDELLKLTLKDNKNGVYDFPSYDEVMEYLKETDANEECEEVMGDLIIQFFDEGFEIDKC